MACSSCSGRPRVRRSPPVRQDSVAYVVVVDGEQVSVHPTRVDALRAARDSGGTVTTVVR